MISKPNEFLQLVTLPQPGLILSAMKFKPAQMIDLSGHLRVWIGPKSYGDAWTFIPVEQKLARVMVNQRMIVSVKRLDEWIRLALMNHKTNEAQFVGYGRNTRTFIQINSVKVR